MLSDLKWGDWRPHLAMMLSNKSSRPEADRKHIITLGDTLGRCCLMTSLDIMAYLWFGICRKCGVYRKIVVSNINRLDIPEQCVVVVYRTPPCILGGAPI